jgi:hypothetical protein
MPAHFIKPNKNIIIVEKTGECPVFLFKASKTGKRPEDKNPIRGIESSVCGVFIVYNKK